jgi:hypothetical protein
MHENNLSDNILFKFRLVEACGKRKFEAAAVVGGDCRCNCNFASSPAGAPGETRVARPLHF